MQDSVEQVHKNLLSAWKGEDFKKVAECLKQLQMFMFRSGTAPAVDEQSLLHIFKDYYEIRALSFVLQNNMDEFEHAIKDVLQFYNACGDAADLRVEQKFPQRNLMHGLYLMFLLASNRLAELRLLIAQIDRSVRANDLYLAVPVELERHLSDGAYNKMALIVNEKKLPSKYYTTFVNTILKQSVQNEIALGLEKAYRSIPIADAAQQLLMSNTAEVVAFGTQRGWLHKGDTFLIGVGTATTEKGGEGTARLALSSGVERELKPLESRQIVAQCLKYAVQLERII